MRILGRNTCIAPNAFKGTLTAAQAARAIARGLRRVLPRAELIEFPIADGGDGFAGVLAAHLRARWMRWRVHNALGLPITAAFAYAGDTAVIELARASGLAQLGRRAPLAASTRGTGELIAAAVNLGARRILLGIGGSASTDGGTGLARALGARFLDKRGNEVPEGGGALQELARVDLSGMHPGLRRAEILVACDVTNPLYGPRGAARVFAPQKGATPAQMRRLDAGLKNLARIIQRDLGLNVQQLPGAGAAGGTGAGLAAFCGAELTNGFNLVAGALGLEKQLRRCDLVITGEGKLDATTVHNKAPAGILRLARKTGVPTIAICGTIAPGSEAIGFDAAFDVHKADPRGDGMRQQKSERAMPQKSLPRTSPRCAAIGFHDLSAGVLIGGRDLWVTPAPRPSVPLPRSTAASDTQTKFPPAQAPSHQLQIKPLRKLQIPPPIPHPIPVIHLDVQTLGIEFIKIHPRRIGVRQRVRIMHPLPKLLPTPASRG